MFINFKVLQEERMSPLKVFILIAIKQKDFEYLKETYWLEERDYLSENGYLTAVKTSKKLEGSTESLRLTPKAKKFLEELETAEVSEEDKKVIDWLCAHYLKMGKTVGNKTRATRHLRDFRIASGIEKNNLIILFLDFLNDEDNMTYNNVLEYALYKPPTAFQTRFNLEDSRLHRHFIKHQKRIESKFEKY